MRTPKIVAILYFTMVACVFCRLTPLECGVFPEAVKLLGPSLALKENIREGTEQRTREIPRG